jgi:hypothetical protein
MPLDPGEILEISSDAVELGAALAAALRSDSPGGKRLTKAEGRALLKQATELAAALAREVLD